MSLIKHKLDIDYTWLGDNAVCLPTEQPSEDMVWWLETYVQGQETDYLWLAEFSPISVGDILTRDGQQREVVKVELRRSTEIERVKGELWVEYGLDWLIYATTEKRKAGLTQ